MITVLTRQGRTQTLRAWAAEAGVHPETLRKRLARGLPLDEALSPTSRVLTHDLTHGGRTMTSAAWARAVGLSVDCVRSRLRLGWSVERALTTPVRGAA